MDNEIERPGFWAVLPAAVRYDPELPSTAKLLYAEISSLTDQRGYCFAPNSYFVKLYRISERTLQDHLRALKVRGFIRIEDGEGGSGRRKIFAGINPLADNPAKNCGDPREKLRGNPAENCTHNSIENKRENIPPKSPQGAKRERKKNEPKDAPEWKPERFRGFWDYYPRHTSKQAAIKAWDALRPADELIDRIAEALRRQKATDEWSRGIGIPYASTYLNQARWTDGEDEPRTTGKASAEDEGGELEWL